LCSLHIGTSGWSYDHWQGILYPHPTPVSRRLPFYLQRYDTVELNYSYYRWPADKTFTGWHERLPDDFVMTVKASRGLTHFARLLHPEQWLERITRGVALLHENLGVLLVQLPPKMACDYPRLEYFLEQVPPWLRVAVEFRHPSWHTEEIFELMEQKGAAYCIMSGANLPCILRATAPFVYVRLHGPDPHYLYGGSYSDDDLRWWAERMREWQAAGRDVFAYFNNDWGGNALRNADTLKALLAS
jgi:uncharacterized protein YecE (DUF72 family)